MKRETVSRQMKFRAGAWSAKLLLGRRSVPPRWGGAVVVLLLVAIAGCTGTPMDDRSPVETSDADDRQTADSMTGDSERPVSTVAGAPEGANDGSAKDQSQAGGEDASAASAPDEGESSVMDLPAPLSPLLPTSTPEVVWPAEAARRNAVAAQARSEPSRQGEVVTPVPSSVDAVIIDHHAVALFDQIPEEYLAAARELHMVYSDRSVGQNINEALDCLASSSWDESPAHCRRDYVDEVWNWTTFRRVDREQGRVPGRILFNPDPVRYSRANWTFDEQSGDWSQLTQDFIERVGPTYADTKDVLSYQITYLNVDAGSDIADPSVGFFSDNPDRYDVHDLEAYMAQHPDKTFFLWTTSLSRAIGTHEATDFNNQMRDYARAKGMFLLDVADIEAHTDQGVPCYDNRDAIEYCNRAGNCENHPDDGLDIPAICQDYTTETEGGHLGSVSAGKIQIAKAFWVLMAQIAGWRPDVAIDPPQLTPQPTETAHLPFRAFLPEVEG